MNRKSYKRSPGRPVKNVNTYYSHGSVAYDQAEQAYEPRRPRTMPPRRIKTVKKPKPVVHTFSWLYTMKVFVLLGMVFVGCMMIMSAHALLAKERIELQKHKDELAAIKNENAILAADISQQVDLEVIREKARIQLGMTEPQDYQMIYIEVPKQSYTVQYATQEIEPSKGESVRGLLDILKKD